MQRQSRQAAFGRTASAVLSGPARTWLLLVGAAILPLLLFGGWVGYLAAIQTRAETSRNAAAAVDGAASRIAADLAAQLDLVRLLAASMALDTPDLTAFRTEAERVQAQHPLWQTIELALPSGPQVLNLLRGPGESLGETADLASLQRVVATGRAVVGGIGPVGPVSGRRLVTLRAPVIRDGKLMFVLSVAVAPDGIGMLLRNTGVPTDWIGVVLDGEGRIVARTRATAQDEGELASLPLRTAIAAAPDGLLRGHTREGVPVEIIYRSLSGAGGWVVAFGVPRAMLERPVRHALVLLVGEGCAGLLLAALLTSAVARDVAQRRADEAERAARSLRASEEGRALAVEAADLGVWSWDAHADVFSGSARTLSLLAAAPGTHGGRSIRWSEATAALRPAESAALLDAVARCLRDGADLDTELRVDLDGTKPRWIRMTGRSGIAAPGQPAILLGVVADITGPKQAEAQRLDLLRDMALAQEEERRRIARELHDQVGQTVTGLSLGLKTLETTLAGTACEPALRDRLTWLRSLAADIGQDIHRAAADLRPAALDDFGLPSALTALAGMLAERHKVSVDIQIIGIVGRLPPAVETVVYRVVQEALTNTVKHARAAHASVRLERRADVMRLVVEDDGIGFDPSQVALDGRPRLGLSGMRERLRLIEGSLDVEAAAGGGTTLFVQIPLGVEDLA
jgi:two-component system sensor histidine kinase UhpB